MTDASILFQNNLTYKLPTPSSVVTNRVLKRQHFQQRQYSAQQTMTCKWNTGTDYVDLKNSALVLKVKTTGASYLASFGEGSGANLIRNIRIYHRSGTCYTNTQKVNLWRKIQDKYNHSDGWFSTVGAMMGYNDSLTFSAIGVGGDEATVIIPLDHLHPFFAPEGGSGGSLLLPSNMASGLLLELDLEDLNTAFKPVGGADTAPDSYSITDCYFQTMNISLMDSAQASLNTTAQKQSLEYVYKDIFTSQNALASGGSQINVDINKSVAFADTAFAVVQDQATLTSFIQDNFESVYKAGKWDYTLGSLHFPNVKVDSQQLSYHNALLTYDKLKHSTKETSVTPQKFEESEAIYAVSLERDTSLALSQSPVNASRSLRFELTLDTAPTTAQLVTVYMTYLTSARSTLLNSKVDI